MLPRPACTLEKHRGGEDSGHCMQRYTGRLAVCDVSGVWRFLGAMGLSRDLRGCSVVGALWTAWLHGWLSEDGLTSSWLRGQDAGFLVYRL